MSLPYHYFGARISTYEFRGYIHCQSTANSRVPNLRPMLSFPVFLSVITPSELSLCAASLGGGGRELVHSHQTCYCLDPRLIPELSAVGLGQFPTFSRPPSLHVGVEIITPFLLRSLGALDEVMGDKAAAASA